MERIRIRRVGEQKSASAESMRPTQLVSVIGALDGWEPAQQHQSAFRLMEDQRGRVLETAVSDLRALERFPSSGEGSNLRDLIGLALRAGAPMVHVMLHDRENGEAAHRLVRDVYERFPLALIVFADLSLWISREPDWAPIVTRYLKSWRQSLRDQHQVGLFDLPPASFDRWGRPTAAPGLVDAINQVHWSTDGVDAACFTWTGHPHGVRRQGWRSASAIAAGLLASTDSGAPNARLLDREVVMPGGRFGTVSRAHEMDGRRWNIALPDSIRHLVNPVELSDDGQSVRFDGQVLMRSEFEIPAHRTLRFLYYILYQAAQRFVFRPATEIEAISLAEQLRDAARLLVANDLVRGSTEDGGVDVDAWVEATPNGPSLVADIGAQLRPWGTNIDLKFRLSGGVVEEAGAV